MVTTKTTNISSSKKVDKNKTNNSLQLFLVVCLILVIGFISFVATRKGVFGKKVDYANLSLAQKAKAKYEELFSGKKLDTNSLASKSAISAGAATTKFDSRLIAPLGNIKPPPDNENIVTDREYKIEYFSNETFPNGPKKGDTVKERTIVANGWSKYVSKTNDTFTSYEISTPQKNISFYGGKYAIEEENSPGFIRYYGAPYSNDEQFLTSIATDSQNYKKLENQTVEGKKVEVYEFNPGMAVTPVGANTTLPIKGAFEPNIQSFSNRYYFDAETFTLIREENYQNNELVYRRTLQKLSNSTLDLAKGLFDSSDMNELGFGTVEVKKIQSVYPLNNSFAEQVQKDSLLVLPVGTKLKTFYSFNSKQDAINTSLRTSKDFNPNTNFYPIFPEISNPAQDIEYNYSYNNFNTFILQKEPDLTSNSQLISGTIKSTTDKTITVNNQVVPAKSYIASYDFSEDQNESLSFSYNGKFVLINSYKDPVITNLYLPTLNQAKEIDSIVLKVSQSYPSFIYQNSLNDITKELRFLPGDISNKGYILNSANKNTNDKTDCDYIKPIEQYNIFSCAIAKSSGVYYDFTPKANEIVGGDAVVKNSFEPSFSWGVVNGKIELPASYLSVFNKEVQLFVSDVDGAKKAVISELGYTQTLYMFEKDSKTVLISINSDSTSILPDQSFFKTLVEQSSIDKDLDTLNKQISENGRVFYPLDSRAGLIIR
jgi:hypothetical protein